MNSYPVTTGITCSGVAVLRCGLLVLAVVPGCLSRGGFDAGPGFASGPGDHSTSGPGDASTPGPGDDAAPAGDSSCPEPADLSEVDCAPVAGCALPALCDGLVLLLHFDNQAEHGEDATHVHDFSGNHNDGTCAAPACPTWTPDATDAGGAFAFLPTHRFEIPDAPSLSITGAVTLSVRFLPESFPGADAFDWRVIAAKVQTVPFQSNYWIGHALDEFALTFHDGGSWQNQRTPLTYAPGEWYHLVGLIDSTNDTMTFWVNGALAYERSVSADMVTDSGTLYVGNAPGDDGVDGRIDDLAIWNRALSPAERAMLHP